MPQKTLIAFLVGPTAIGKSEVACRLAKKLGAEIISCDSMQIYKGMEIVASQPTSKQQKQVKHHLIATVAQSKEYNVSRFRKDALKAINDILKRGRVPLLVGGTGLYVSVLVDGIFEAKASDKKFRQRLFKEAEIKGSAFLHQRLMRVDRRAADKIHPNDAKRIIRALEVFECTGKPISDLQKQRKGLIDKFDVRIFCLDMDRDKLYQRADKRVDKMFRHGLANEVKKLLKHKLSKTASYAIGIEQLRGYFEGKCGLQEAKCQMKQATRNYAKRQLTWFRKDKRINWIKLSEKEAPEAVAQRIWKELS